VVEVLAEGAELVFVEDVDVVPALVFAEDEDVVVPELVVVVTLVLVVVVPALSLVAGVEEAPAAVDVTSLEPELAPDAADVRVIERILVPVGGEVTVRVTLPELHN